MNKTDNLEEIRKGILDGFKNVCKELKTQLAVPRWGFKKKYFDHLQRLAINKLQKEITGVDNEDEMVLRCDDFKSEITEKMASIDRKKWRRINREKSEATEKDVLRKSHNLHRWILIVGVLGVLISICLGVIELLLNSKSESSPPPSNTIPPKPWANVSLEFRMYFSVGGYTIDTDNIKKFENQLSRNSNLNEIKESLIALSRTSIARPFVIHLASQADGYFEQIKIAERTGDKHAIEEAYKKRNEKNDTLVIRRSVAVKQMLDSLLNAHGIAEFFSTVIDIPSNWWEKVSPDKPPNKTNEQYRVTLIEIR